MPMKTPEEMYDNAISNDFALGAFNVYSLESLQAVVNASEKQKAPIIIQVSMGARKYVKKLKPFCDFIKSYVSDSDAQVFLQHDHCPTIESCKEAIQAGVQAVMYDGSHLSFEENIKTTKEIVKYAHDRGIWVEAELGRIPGFEDQIYAGHSELTDSKKAKEFIALTKCDSLAISVGTAHGGVVADDYLPLHFDVLKKIIKENPNYPFVLHGGASLPQTLIDKCNSLGGNVDALKMCKEEDISKAVEFGIKKVNMDVDNFLAHTIAIRYFLSNKPEVYDPRKYLSFARDAFEEEVKHKIEFVLRSKGKNI